MVDLDVLVLGGAAILSATFLAGVVGFANSLVALPLLLLVGVPLTDVVVINLVVGLLTRVVVLVRRHADVSPARAGLLTLGSVPGVALGLLTRDVLATEAVQLGAGVATLLAVAGIVYRSRHVAARRARTPTVLLAGTAGGFLGVTTSLNGIPPALLLTGDRASARATVADLAAYFVVGNALTLAVMSFAGIDVSPGMGWALAAWLPVALLGNHLGIRLGPRLPFGVFRQLTLAVVVVSGVASVLQAVLAIV